MLARVRGWVQIPSLDSAFYARVHQTHYDPSSEEFDELVTFEMLLREYEIDLLRRTHELFELRI